MKTKVFFKKATRRLHILMSRRLVELLWVHWFNPFYTIVFNFIFFPPKQAIQLPVFIFGWPRLHATFGNMRCEDQICPGMVRINTNNTGAPQNSDCNVELMIMGHIIFHGKCNIGAGSRINVGEQGVLSMGDGTKIMQACNITVYSRLDIGEQSWIVHRCQVLDTNFHYIADFKHGVVKRIAHPIEIGSYCWVCNSSTIVGGAKIPDKTIVASNSLVNKDMTGIPPESIIGGQPAKLISTGYRRVDSVRFQKVIQEYFAKYPDADYYPLPNNTSHDVCDVDSL